LKKKTENSDFKDFGQNQPLFAFWNFALRRAKASQS
jgi:hypothetical protein